jgi:hypothetical protein
MIVTSGASVNVRIPVITQSCARVSPSLIDQSRRVVRLRPNSKDGLFRPRKF